MAEILVTKFGDEVVIAPVTLTASDTATVLTNGGESVLVVENATGGDLNLKIASDATSGICPGIGEIDLSGGLAKTVVDGATLQIPLNPTDQKWLGSGALTITGGTGATAYILAK